MNFPYHLYFLLAQVTLLSSVPQGIANWSSYSHFYSSQATVHTMRINVLGRK